MPDCTTFPAVADAPPYFSWVPGGTSEAGIVPSTVESLVVIDNDPAAVAVRRDPAELAPSDIVYEHKRDLSRLRLIT